MLCFSAGIGRTGTFIALDVLQAQGERDGRINIVEFVHMMREDRMNMIQNAVSTVKKRSVNPRYSLWFFVLFLFFNEIFFMHKILYLSMTSG